VVWLFNTVGTVDLLLAYFNGGRFGVGLVPGLQGAMYFVPALLVPLLLVTHVLVFRLLLRRDARRAASLARPWSGGERAVGPAPRGVS
jgi:hypothetical protein